MSPRWYDKRTGDHLALDTGGGALARLWATALAARSTRRYVKATGTSVQINLPKTPDTPETRVRVEGPAVVQRDRARPRADLLRRLRGGDGAALPRPGVRGDPRRPDEGLRGLRRPRRGHRLRVPRGGARRALAPPRDPRRQDRQLPPVPADAVEREPDGLLRHARARTRTRCRASRSSRRTGRTTSAASTSCARCGQLRPVPALRGAHVPRQREDDQAGPLADVRASTAERAAPWTTAPCASGSGRSSPAGGRRGPRRPGRRARRRPSWRARCSTSTARGSRGSSDVAEATDGSLAPGSRRRARLAPAAAARAASGAARAAGARRRSTRCGRTSSSHGGDVELLGRRGRRRAAARCAGSCDGCPSSAVTLKLAIEDAIHQAAPDVEDIEAEGAVEAAPPAPALLQIELVGGAGRRRWPTARGRRPAACPSCATASPSLQDVAGELVLFCRARRRTYAYRPRCPGVRASLGGGALRGAELALRGLRRPLRRAPRRPRARRAAAAPRARAAARRRRRDRQGRARGGGMRPMAVDAARSRLAPAGAPRPASARRRSSAARCAARRSRRSTATCSTSTRASCCAPAAPARSSSTARRRPTGTGGSCPTAGCGSTTSRSTTWPGRSCACRSTSPSSSTARPSERVMAYYPGPMGATESLLRPRGVARARAGQPGAASSSPTSRRCSSTARSARAEQWIVPIDECLRLVGVIRTRWRGSPAARRSGRRSGGSSTSSTGARDRSAPRRPRSDGRAPRTAEGS